LEYDKHWQQLNRFRCDAYLLLCMLTQAAQELEGALFARERAVYQSRKEASVVEAILVEHVRGFAPSQWTSIVYASSVLKAVPMITITP
jgi:hypothetical protein